MKNSESTKLGEVAAAKRLLLMAAAVHGLGPETDLSVANSRIVVGQALVWAELVDDDLRLAWRKFEFRPAIVFCYGLLIEMIQQKPTSRALFEGGGHFGTPEAPVTFPHFTSCRLTVRGWRAAEPLLAIHQEYRRAAERGAECSRTGNRKFWHL